MGISSGVCLDALYCCDKHHEQATKGRKGLFLLTLPGEHLSLKEAKMGPWRQDLKQKAGEMLFRLALL